MTFFGELLGYDSHDRDVFGANRDPDYNCVVCGLDATAHSREMNEECLRRLYGSGPHTSTLKEVEGR